MSVREQGRRSIDSRPFLRLLERLVLALLRLVYRVRVSGTEHVPPAGPLVVASNHPSFLDPPILFLVFPREIRFMAWNRLFAQPRIAALLGIVGAIPVDLDGIRPSTLRSARQVLEADQVLGIFPEGHRTRSARIDVFRRGVVTLAAEAGAAVVPVSISGARRVWGVERRWPRLGGRITVAIHAPIDPPPPGDAAAAEVFLARVRSVIDEALSD